MESSERITVPGFGRTPSAVMIVGEAPGVEEARKGRPFVGKSGREQDWYLSHNCQCGHHRRHHATTYDARGRLVLGACDADSCDCDRHRHVRSTSIYKTNVVKEYRTGNPDPSPAQIREWTPVLEREIEKCQPHTIFAVGRFAARWFLGDRADMEIVHGLPHQAGCFDASLAHRSRGAVVVPVYHPAAGLYDSAMKGLIDWDYEQACHVAWERERGLDVTTIDQLDTIGLEKARKHYVDVPGEMLGTWYGKYPPRVLGLDTEGSPSRPWSIQLSDHPGYAMMLRTSRPDFAAGIDTLQRIIDGGTLLVMHNAPFDVSMCEAMGLDMSSASIWDTMDAAYFEGVEPQGLQGLAWRTCGLWTDKYADLVGAAGVEKQLDYLLEVEGGSWDKPEAQLIHENDGTSRVYQPQTVQSRAKKILLDYYGDKRDKDGNPVDVYKRWMDVDADVRGIAEADLGPMHESSLEDVDLETATEYACRDADAALRIYLAKAPSAPWKDLHDEAMDLFPVFYEMMKDGMPASRSHFESLAAEMTESMHRVGARISERYYGGKPFNPNSPVDVAKLLKKRGLKAEKTTKTGRVSTSKKSIEHLSDEDDAIADVFEWRSYAHVRDAFCTPILSFIPDEGEDLGRVRCQIKTTRTATRRLASADPNLLAIPVRDELGRRVREGFIAPEGLAFGAWDLSGIEMRKAASLSGDPLMCRLFREGGDLHSETVSSIFGIPRDEVDKSDLSTRIPAKTAGFGVLYGIQPSGLLDQLRQLGLPQWDEASCADLIEKWLDTYPGVREYIERTGREVAETGIVYDEWGMPRRIPGIWHYSPHIAAEAGRIAVSHRVQGGAQGMIRNSMRWLKKRVAELQAMSFTVQWCLQIHDEVVLLFDEDLWEMLDDIVVEALTCHHGSDMVVPVEASGHMARSWGGLK